MGDSETDKMPYGRCTGFVQFSQDRYGVLFEDGTFVTHDFATGRSTIAQREEYRIKEELGANMRIMKSGKVSFWRNGGHFTFDPASNKIMLYRIEDEGI